MDRKTEAQPENQNLLDPTGYYDQVDGRPDPENSNLNNEVLATMDQMNTYVDLKTYGKGFVDFALMTANANLLWHMINSESEDLSRTLTIIFLSISMFLQIIGELY